MRTDPLVTRWSGELLPATGFSWWRLRRSLTGYLFVLPAVVFLGALLAYPLVFNLVLSFQDRTLGNLFHGATPWVGFANYETAFADPQFGSAAWHSVVFTVSAVALQLVIALALALLYAKSFPGAKVMRSLYLTGYAIPIVVSAQVFRWLLDGRSGLVNWVLGGLGLESSPTYWLSDTGLALPALILVQVWLGIPFTLVNLLSGLVGIPRELYEAAAIDGAGPWTRFRYVTWPLLRPTFAASAVLSLIFTFKSFDLVWIATQGGPAGASDILPTLAYRSVFLEFLFGKGAAVLNIVFVVLFGLAVLYLLTTRREEAEA
ncbi:carbohydrate ABC transporter permease [Kutzneria buriramensis]|uniref:Multiple sugar transport system permease protein n=1 Tax=Kutzneria buriramensis TaxID=1045776 RepID=A0A3E0H840_9PSEU|nr:sugar ABC transporter permease [Kutzneria buriramensis]REH39478.1 multiple sugar transport system permease protein [Kutzneria buriramensis]